MVRNIEANKEYVDFAPLTDVMKKILTSASFNS